MKNTQAVVLALGCFLLGGISVASFFWLRQGEESRITEQRFPPSAAGNSPALNGPAISSFGNEDEEVDPLAETEKMQEQVRQGFFGIGENDGQEVVQREDAHSIYFEISGADQSKLSTSVKNGYLTIRGEIQKEMGAGGFSGVMTSSFQRMLPLPRNIDPLKMETTSEKDKVVLRFPKRKSP